MLLTNWHCGFTCATRFPEGWGGHSLPPLLWGLVAPAGGGDPRNLALVGFAVVYFAAIAGARIVYPRYVLPLIPVLAAFAAESSVWLAARFDTEQLLLRS